MAETTLHKAPKRSETTIYPSDHLQLSVPQSQPAGDGRPQPVKHMSTPAYQSPIRHHTRVPLTPRKHVKETLNARSQYSNSGGDGTAEHRINQYLIKEEVGRGSFGAVHVAVDQYGQEYAVKEFSKSRLRKRAQSNLLRNNKQKPKPGHATRGKAFNSPLHRHESSQDINALDLIREEVAVMKKLDHPNVVSLYEVLDDPEEDSLYMVMEMCKKGVVMKVGLDQTSEPYDTEKCRLLFRDMILGLEYLHAQGIIHRDIKPDNCLITENDTLKFVDFGVSEMFEKDSDMNTKKSAGSPAFMPPELCVAKHGEVSGRACDVWSAGVTLYCLRYGHIPFEKGSMLELYECIKHDDFDMGSEKDENFTHLMRRLLEKDPEKRITIEELREHPWVTKDGTDPLLPRDENIATILEPPTQEEVNHAITSEMGHLMVVMKAAKRFKQLLSRRRPELMDSIFGNSSRFVQPPLSISPIGRTKSYDLENRRPIEYALTTEGVHRDVTVSDDLKKQPEHVNAVAVHATSTKPDEHQIDEAEGAVKEAELLRKSVETPERRTNAPRKGQAHDPLEDTLFLGIGTGTAQPAEAGSFSVVCESPGAVGFNVYEKAYQEEVERALAKKQEAEVEDHPAPTLYLTRRVEHIKELRENEHITDHLRAKMAIPAGLALKKLVEQAKSNVEGTTTMRSSTVDPLPGVGLRKILDAGNSSKEKLETAAESVKEKVRSSSVDGGRASEGTSKSEPSAKENVEAARTAAGSQPEEPRAKTRFGGFNKLMGKARQQFEAARSTKP